MIEPQTREQVLVLYAEAMLAVQDLEEALVGVLGTQGEIAADIPGEDPYEALDRIWSDLFRRTAGWLVCELKDNPAISAELAEELGAAVNARNLLAHHYLRDHRALLETEAGRVAGAAHLVRARDRFRDLWRRVETERMSEMHSAGLTDDHITTPRFAGEMRDSMRYNDGVNERFVPPEPFEDADG